MSASLAENMEILCRFWLDKKALYFFSRQSHCNSFFKDVRDGPLEKLWGGRGTKYKKKFAQGKIK